MKWYDKLYLGESIEKEARKLKWKINHRIRTASVFVIAFASNPENLLDIIPSREILQKGYPKYEIEIIGLAQGYEEALQVVLRIIDETYQNTGNTDVRAYMEKIPNNYKTVAEGENR